MRSTLLVPLALLSLTFSCGRGFEPTPHRPDPLIACEELGRADCTGRSDCAVEAYACAALCADDGLGGCVPCDAFACVPVTPPPPTACEQLDANACSSRGDCQLETPACASLCEDDGPGGCPPCGGQPRCVTRPPSSACEQLDPSVCAATPGCAVVAAGACPPCPPGALCSPCQVTQDCISVLPSACEQLDPSACAATPGCAVAAAGACPACEPGGTCPPCTMSPTCVAVDPPSPCPGFDVGTCSAHPECEVVSAVCAAVCIDDGAGGCLPCNAPPPSCQPRPEEPVAGCGSGGSQPPQP